jgi:hypothetical protein
MSEQEKYELQKAIQSINESLKLHKILKEGVLVYGS